MVKLILILISVSIADISDINISIVNNAPAIEHLSPEFYSSRKTKITKIKGLLFILRKITTSLDICKALTLCHR